MLGPQSPDETKPRLDLVRNCLTSTKVRDLDDPFLRLPTHTHPVAALRNLAPRNRQISKARSTYTHPSGGLRNGDRPSRLSSPSRTAPPAAAASAAREYGLPFHDSGSAVTPPALPCPLPQ